MRLLLAFLVLFVAAMASAAEPDNQIEDQTVIVNSTGGVTGLLLINQIKSSIDGILEHARDIGDDLARRLQQTAQVTVTQLEQALRSDIARPIDELGGSLRLVADRAQTVAQELAAIERATALCTAQDVRLFAAVIDASLSANVRELAFWNGQKSFVAAGYVLSGSESRMGIYPGRGRVSYKFIGAFNGLDVSCGLPAVMLEAEGRSFPLEILAADPRSIVVQVPNLATPGTDRVGIRFKKRTGLFRRCSTSGELVRSLLLVVPRPRFEAALRARATCNVPQAEQKLGSIRFGNRDCNGDKTDGLVLCPDPGSDYASYGVNVLSNNGCRYTLDQPGGGCVRVNAVCPERGGFLCTGPGKWLDLDLYLRTTHPVARDGAPLATPLSAALGYEQTARQLLFDPGAPPVAGGQAARDCVWTVSADVRWPDGKTTALPTRRGASSLTAGADGIRYEFEPADGSMTISTPPYACEYVY